MPKEIPSIIITVNGPDELREQLGQLKTDIDPEKNEHYFLYRFNEQQSYLKVDTSQMPYYVWYADGADRPATRLVKDIVAEFTDKFEDYYEKDKRSRVEATITGEQFIPYDSPLERLEQARRPSEPAEQLIEPAIRQSSQVKAGKGLFGFFGSRRSKAKIPEKTTDDLGPKPGKLPK